MCLPTETELSPQALDQIVEAEGRLALAEFDAGVKKLAADAALRDAGPDLLDELKWLLKVMEENAGIVHFETDDLKRLRRLAARAEGRPDPYKRAGKAVVA